MQSQNAAVTDHSRFDSAQIRTTPAATPEETAAIVAALELLWPRPVPAAAHASPPSKWRFSGRPWHAPASWPAVRYR